MRKKKNSQSIGTTPIECTTVNEAETILAEGGLNTPEKEADGQVTTTENEVEHLVAVKDNVADDLATTDESEVADNIAVADTERENCPTPSKTGTVIGPGYFSLMRQSSTAYRPRRTDPGQGIGPWRFYIR